MNRVSRRLGRRWLTLAMAAFALSGVLMACSASPEGAAPQSGGTATAPAPGMKDGVGAPAPEFGPPPADAQRDVVKTASMTITVSNTSEAADKAAVLAEEADGRVDSRSEDAGSERGLARTASVLRVPVAKLDEVVRNLKTLGTVQNAETRSEDVTAQRVDLDARIKALQTSVDRLLAQKNRASRPLRNPSSLPSHSWQRPGDDPHLIRDPRQRQGFRQCNQPS
jgi:hypothetical protein